MTKTVKIALFLLFLINLKIAAGAYEGLNPNPYRVRSGTIGDGLNSSGAGTTIANYTFWGNVLGVNFNTCTSNQASVWNGSWFTCTPLTSTNLTAFSLEYVFDGQGSVITANTSFWISLPYSGTLTALNVSADVNTSANINISKGVRPANNSFPTFTDITGGNQVNLTQQGSLTNGTLTDWITAINKGDMIKVNIYSVDNATKILVALDGTKS